eukprot:m.152496 g.152496  ORF g.152496 m.152496 type:complete len:686 (+) comp38593_c0_seq2:106-2163(+)
MFCTLIVLSVTACLAAADGGEFVDREGTGGGNCSLPCSPEKGEPGHVGDRGRRGEKGTIGPRGPQGKFPYFFHWHIKQQPGSPGSDGPPGSDGEAGERGIKGRKGDVGVGDIPGSQGEAGLPGQSGDVGQKGAAGQSGLDGPLGPPGDKGVKGEDGSRMRRGEPGADGEPGDVGNDGLSGTRGGKGPTGDVGAKGRNGIKGEAGPPAQSEGSIVKGSKGEVGPKGLTGRKGNKGFHGNPGLPAQNITSVEGVLSTPCKSDNEGEIHYETATGEIIFCDGTSWQCADTKTCESCTEGTFYKVEELQREGVQLRQAADIVLVVDDSGSMQTEQRWIAEAASALETALIRVGVGTGELKNLFYVVLFGNGQRIAATGQGWRQNRTWPIYVGDKIGLRVHEVPEAVKGFTRDGNAEDGYQAIELALDLKELRNDPKRVALNIALITDEPRDPFAGGEAGTESSLDEIIQKLKNKGAKVNVFGNFGFQENVLSVDYQGQQYTATGVISTNEFQDEDKVVSFAANEPECRAFVQYAPLAMSTQGAVWNLEFVDTTAGDQTARQQFTDSVARIKVFEIVNTTVCLKCEIKCEGPGGRKNETCTQEVDQIFCRCLASGKSESECRRTAIGSKDLQSSQYDYSALYKSCAAQGYPTHFEGWCDPNWLYNGGKTVCDCGNVSSEEKDRCKEQSLG